MQGLIGQTLRNRKAAVGLILLAIIVLAAVLAPLLTEYQPLQRIGRPHQAPSAEHWLGTTRLGQDVFAQLLYGARTSLLVGFAAGILITIVGTIAGLAGGYFGGKVDAAINVAANTVLVVPNLPLLLVLAAFIGQAGPLVIVFILSATSWAWGCRVTRSQTLAIRTKEFIQASEIGGESRWRIVFVEILPNLASIVMINLIGSVIFAVVTEATLEFLGLGNPQTVSWGMILYNAQNTSALTVGAWWEVLAPCIGLALLGTALSLVNNAIDEVSNPRLRAGLALQRWKVRLKQVRERA
jgi:peptide/nickel transport system permease protein